MPKGGKREGAGRKPGVPNKRTIAERDQLAASGEMPRDYMLRVMRDPTVEHERRDRMAQAVAPYIHQRLNALVPPSEGSGSMTITWKTTA